MQKYMIFGLMAVLGLVNHARADGFVCNGMSTGLKVRIYNHTQAAEGTRSPAIMVISDPSAKQNEQTLTTFSSEAQNLSYQGYGTYVGTLGAANNEMTTDRNIAGTKMSSLETIEVAINFSYTSGTATLAKITVSIPGTISYHEKNGEFIQEKLDCTRYLKN